MKPELQFLKEFRERNLNQINGRVLNPKISKEDKAYNEGTNDTCKEQNKILDKRIKELEKGTSSPHSGNGGKNAE